MEIKLIIYSDLILISIVKRAAFGEGRCHFSLIVTTHLKQGLLLTGDDDHHHDLQGETATTRRPQRCVRLHAKFEA